jgi:putative phosphoesterase
MKIGIISDIHGNLPALKVILGELSRRRVSEVICAGDIVGYYPFVNEVIEELRRLGVLAIIGNHDHAVIQGVGIEESYSANIGVQYARKVISPDNYKYLLSLDSFREVRIGSVDITIFHGTPSDHLNGRVQAVTDLDSTRVRTRFAVGGHTHIPAVIRREGMLFVNPGACGQPRDFDVRASCAILDLDSMAVEFPRELYDIDAVYEKMAELGFDPRVAWSLYAGEWIGASKLNPASGLTLATELERSYHCWKYRYCYHVKNRETSARYNCYIQDGQPRLVSAPRYINGGTSIGLGREQIKVKMNAVASFKVLDGDLTLQSEHFNEVEDLRNSLGGDDGTP